MNNSTFQRAESIYRQGDYRSALRKYTECLKDEANPLGTGEYGKIYHRIGNCLMKINNPVEAIKAYKQAETDEGYTEAGSLHNNLGKAYAKQKNFSEAIAEYEKAVEDNNFASKYKAYMGMGNAQLKTGNTAEAGICFREAALDEANPDPAKALLNLGVCFMGLNRPADAISSYNSALDFNMDKDTKNSLYASMGQAYSANGQPSEAVDAFKKATADGTYKLSDSASVDYSKCVSDVARGVTQTPEVSEPDFSGLDVATEETFESEPQEQFFYDDGTQAIENVQGYVDAYEGNSEQFFNATDSELTDLYKKMAKKDRKRRNVGLRVFLVILVLILILAGVGVFGYTQGYGYPTQESVAEQLVKNPTSPDASLFAKTLTSNSISTMTSAVVKDDNANVTAVQRGMSESSVYVSAKSENGGDINYKITMTREIIGWKISSIELYFASQN